MKKIAFILLTVMFFASLSAQTTVKEPEFAGEIVLLNSDSTTTLLEKSTVQIKINSAAIQLTGFGSAKEKLTIAGCCASVRTHSGRIQLIVRAVDNISDPMSIIQIIKFDVSKKARKTELASVSAFGASSNNMQLLPFTGKKYGTASYLLITANAEKGEYGVIVRNPNSRDEKTTVVSTFAID
ncbi:MAG: hypothetical protein LBN27_12525 [Prevotellaceae bacterium]|jgi:hypothetical protein|nr:hypothetical protein [Prevotellaceae bacterium]